MTDREPQTWETALRRELTSKRGYPVTPTVGGQETGITRWVTDPHGAYVGFEDAWDVVLSALATAQEPDTRPALAYVGPMECPDCGSPNGVKVTDTRPASVAGLDAETLARALDEHHHAPPGDWPCTAQCADAILASLRDPR